MGLFWLVRFWDICVEIPNKPSCVFVFVFNFWFSLCLRCVSFDSVCVCLLLDPMKNFGCRSLKPTWGFGWLWFKVVWWNHSDVRVLVLIAVIGCDSFVLCIIIDWQWNYTAILWFMFWTVLFYVSEYEYNWLQKLYILVDMFLGLDFPC